MIRGLSRTPARPGVLAAARGAAGLAAAVVAASVFALSDPAAASAAPPDASAALPPTIQTTATEIVPGEPFEVTLAGWPAGIVSLSLCGERAALGSGDCATEQAVAAIVGADGAGAQTLVGALPPVPCPCVLRATTLTDRITATLPVVLRGATVSNAAPAAAPTGVPVSHLVVASSVAQVGSWFDRALAALGGPADYRMSITVQNIGTLASAPRTVDLLVGRDSLGGAAATAFPVAAVAPGSTQDYAVDVRIGAPLIGGYTLHGELDPADSGSVFVARVESWPIVPAVAILYLLSWLVLRGSAQRARRAGQASRVVPSLRAVAVASVVCGVVLLGNWGIAGLLEDAGARQAQSELLASFPTSAPADADAQVSASRETNPPATGDLVGVLRIPALGDLQLAIVEGITPEQLARGPGHYPGTALPGELGNVVVAGHNARSGAGAPFVDLDAVHPGDRITLETAAGTWTYTVTGARVVAPTQVSVLLPVRDDPNARPTTSQLTLITCSYSEGGGTDRLIVEAEIVDPEDAAS